MTVVNPFPTRPALLFAAGLLAIGMAVPGITYAVLGGPEDGALIVPALWPPQWAFWAVWTVLYPTMGVATAYVWRERDQNPFAKSALAVFALHFIVNISWIPIVQVSHRPLTVSVVMDFVVFIASLIAMWAYAQVSRSALLWLVPYLGWEVFTTTIKVWRLLLNT